ncbi:phosphatase PAP2 family protein [Pontibacter sp. SGAir0037]|uniref:phosphatase PAP2 family protein n=1 Tax=Pontibacter sp. SGAir0037 TaxID=2571030 RepID=UPI0010CCB2FD|nr:phosphatase PAP2 family protein [Pontibacter sp. SGAir0037]QCR21588.1 PA-phosphatase [Pontibacter sp. SGAir0037]
MKKRFTFIVTGLSLCLLVACDKDIVESNAGYQALQPAVTDAQAGNWTPVIVSSAAEFPLPAPQPTTSAAYQQELKELKAMRSSLTEEQQRVINYWKVGSVLRWNEIMRELVAKHNLPPYQNGDNTYPVPSAANPFAYPTFPFSNPPYAARAYAYVSVAQYDALVMAHHFKEVYKRAAPYKVDAAIQPAIPKSELAAYPSEDAVVAGVTLEMMKLLFPADRAYIDRLVEEEKNYRLWSGANVRSDVVAGDSLGRWVARKIIQRAKTDGMGAAGGNAELWTKLEDECKAKGETPWYSLETPKRPPMLPLFGNVKPLLFESAAVASLRPGPPPGATSKKMREELDEVLQYTRNPTREQMRIVNFWADGVGTYTPPGHWNAIATEEFVKKNYSEVRWARNYALLNAALMDAAIMCWNTKYHYFNARPCQLDPRIKTLTGVPNFPAYISGHSTFSGAAATVLSYLVPEKAGEFKLMAQEASNSRLFGGIHYRSDCESGLETGNKVGRYAILRAQTDGAD